jgi:drug/metabolite transporter (DMT)-like permease
LKVAAFEPRAGHGPPITGVVLMICAVTLFGIMDAGAKYLSERYPVILVVWARFFFNVLIMLLVLGPVFGRRLISTRRPGIQLIRGMALGIASVLFVSALPYMRLADASAVSFVTPMLVTLGAVYVFRQKAPSGTWIALAASFLGVLLVIQPGSSTFTWAALLPLCTAIFAAVYQLLTSRLAGVDGGVTSLFIGALVSVAVLTIPVMFYWTWPRSLADALLFVGVGAMGTFSHYLIIRAFDYAPPVVLAPFAYLQIVAALLLGWLVFGNFPGPVSLFGMALIVVTGVVMGLRQRVPVARRVRPAVPQAAAAPEAAASGTGGGEMRKEEAGG